MANTTHPTPAPDGPADAGPDQIRPFRIEIPQADLDDLRERLARTRRTEELPDANDEMGVPMRLVDRLLERWRTGYDWRAWEARLNELPQFVTTIDGQDVHFVHVRSAEADATPLLLTHGWPTTFVEFVDLVGPLTDPRAHGGDPSDAFHLVIPSIPGFGFSGPTNERGWNRHRIARAWAELMARLGYERYGAGGNDAGSLISPEVGRCDPDHVSGVHVTQVFSFPSGDPAEMAELSEGDMGKLAFLQQFWETQGAFNLLQSSQPQTLAHALADSPVGQLAWSAQLFGDSVDPEHVLTNVCIYWFTNTAASSARLYWEDNHVPESETPTGPTTVPLGLANFAADFQSIRPFAERDHANIVSWNVYDVGDHFAAHTATDELVTDLRSFFRLVG